MVNSTESTPSLTNNNPGTVYKTTTVSLHGGVSYYTYAKETKELLQSVTNDAEGTLELLEGNQIRLTLTETSLSRTVVLEGKLTLGRLVKMVYVNPPTDVLRQIVQGHSGCTILGRFGVYHGMFNGKQMFAGMRFKSECPVEWPQNDIFPTPVDGPVHWWWVINLRVND
jgi:hypothetical protein